MERQNKIQRQWLIIARGIAYISIGVLMFLFANTYSSEAGYAIGILAAGAGVCQLLFSTANRHTDRNFIWGLLHGISDLGFGIAIFIYAKGTVKGFVDVLGFWAMMYAFLQAVQAMYVFLGARTGNVPNYATAVIHFINVFVAGGLAFNLLLRPEGFNTSLGISGLFPIVLGALILILTQRLKEQATISQVDSPMR